MKIQHGKKRVRGGAELLYTREMLVVRVDHQRSDTMHSRTLFPGIRTNVVHLLHTENVVRLHTKSEELARLYHWFMPSKRSLSDVT